MTPELNQDLEQSLE
jgi:hypothetical protein